MKKISYIGFLTALCATTCAHAKYDNGKFRSEVVRGLDLISAQETFEDVPTVAPGELGAEVYRIVGNVDNDTKLFVPTSMYLRFGGGLNLGFATDQAIYNGTEFESSGSYTTQIGLGWNLSSYVRAETDLQYSVFKFSDLDKLQATYHTVGGTLYFDLARRYVQSGDVTFRRTFVPFIGVGAAFGAYEFQGPNGADGMVIAAPRATIGFNVMLNDLIGIDVAYQYQMMIGNGFGWDADNGGVDNISNIVASVRANF